MAKIVFGLAAPHSGMLTNPPEEWPKAGERDRNNPALWYRNRPWTYPELEAHRKAAFEPFLTLEERRARYARCNAALEKLSQIYQQANIDVAVILGKDQKEIFLDFSPMFAVYTGEEVHNGPPQRKGWGPDRHVVHKAHPQLALHIIESLKRERFDLTDLFAWPQNMWMKPPPEYPVVPHAYGFIYERIMRNAPPPHVPILFNCFYPPTQPSMRRCIEFGQALRSAIRSWPEDLRVAVVASGGLTHFVADEEFDRRILDMLAAYDYEGLAAIDDRSYQSGTSEIKLYTSVMMALQDTGAKMTLVDYVPCYRTAAGTGEGMGFMYWQAPT